METTLAWVEMMSTWLGRTDPPNVRLSQGRILNSPMIALWNKLILIPTQIPDGIFQQICVNRKAHLNWKRALKIPLVNRAHLKVLRTTHCPQWIQKDAPMAWVGFPPNPAQAGVSIFSFRIADFRKRI